MKKWLAPIFSAIGKARWSILTVVAFLAYPVGYHILLRDVAATRNALGLLMPVPLFLQLLEQLSGYACAFFIGYKAIYPLLAKQRDDRNTIDLAMLAGYHIVLLVCVLRLFAIQTNSLNIELERSRREHPVPNVPAK